jgi:hypothetical protein
MRNLVVKNVDEQTYKALEKRAKADGRPLDDWILSRLRFEAAQVDPSLASRPTKEDVRRRVEDAARIRAMTPRRLDEDSTKHIRADRDRR